MAIRFIIGRAGTGKTHHCLEAIRRRLRQDPIDGPRLIFFVPEQAALQMERAILQPDDIAGAHRVDVLSFQRLAYRVLDWTGGGLRQALSEPARAMVLRHLLARRASELHYYHRVDRLGGFIDRLSTTITELIQEAVNPEDLAAVSDPTTGLEPVQSAKLHDIRLLYRDYLEYLGDARVDPSQYLQVAREHLGRCPWLDGAELWVDGFASLSRQETLTLVALTRLCARVEVTVLMDPVPGAGTAASPRDLAKAQLFRRPRRTYEDLHGAFTAAGLVVEEPLLLRPKVPPRFRSAESLARLEDSLLAMNAPDGTGPEASSARVELVQLPSRRIEVEYAVARICRWVQDPHTSWRYRDLAIIARDLEPYHDLLSEALAARGIPFFIDRRRPTAHHPLVELLRAATAMAAEQLSLESVRFVLKTGLIPLPPDSADELENYVVAHDLFGFDDWRGVDWAFVGRASFGQAEGEPTPVETARLARVNRTRRTFLSLIDRWLEFAADAGGHRGPEWAEAIRAWLTRLEVGSTLERWTAAAEADGDIDQAAEHRQVWRETLSVLDDLAFAFAEVNLTTEEFARVVESGLSGLTLGLAPPMVDQLLVGAIERSRHPDIKAAVILGFNDGVFPHRIAEDAILNDDDRDYLRSQGVRVGPPARERILDEALLLYVILTRASEALVVTWAAADNDGRALRLSPYADALRMAGRGLTERGIGDPIRERATWDILSPADLTSRLVAEFRDRPAKQRDDLSIRSRWNELYDSVRAQLARDRTAHRALQSLAERRPAALSPRSIERLIRGPLRTSVSRLETYAACPFQYFARYALSLSEREEATLDPVDVGQVHHAVLEDFVKTVSPHDRGLGQLGEDELLERLDESCRRIGARLPASGVLSNARNAYVLRRSRAHLARVMQAQRTAARAGAARPRAAELPFGFDRPGGLPAIGLKTPAGRQMLLRGFIDRVDLAELGDELLGIVIDYKRTRDKRLEMQKVYHGLSLQLPAYLLALALSGRSLAGRPVRPIAALYVSLVPQYHLVDHPALADARTVGQRGTYRPRGLLLAGAFEALDRSTAAGWSEQYNVFRKKDGSLGHLDSSDAADAGSFQAVIEHTRAKLGELGDGILDGDVAVRPYRLGTFSPCSWCTMASVCRFEMGICDVRFLETLKRSDVFQRLTAGCPKSLSQ